MNKLALALICIGMVFGVVYVSQANDWQTVDSERLASCIVGNPPPPTDCFNDDGTPCDEPAGECCVKPEHKTCQQKAIDDCRTSPNCPNGHLQFPSCGTASCITDTRPNTSCDTPSRTISFTSEKCKLTGQTTSCPTPANTEHCASKQSFYVIISTTVCNTTGTSLCSSSQQPTNACN